MTNPFCLKDHLCCLHILLHSFNHFPSIPCFFFANQCTNNLDCIIPILWCITTYHWSVMYCANYNNFKNPDHKTECRVTCCTDSEIHAAWPRLCLGQLLWTLLLLLLLIHKQWVNTLNNSHMVQPWSTSTLTSCGHMTTISWLLPGSAGNVKKKNKKTFSFF